jgi:hypothetical protein
VIDRKRGKVERIRITLYEGVLRCEVTGFSLLWGVYIVRGRERASGKGGTEKEFLAVGVAFVELLYSR